VGRFRRALGEAGVEALLAKTVEAAVGMKAIPLKSFERVIVDTTVQEKAIAHPTDSRLLDIARAKLVQFAQRESIPLKQSFEREGKLNLSPKCGHQRIAETQSYPWRRASLATNAKPQWVTRRA
jgi:hypothetical protein